MLMAKRLDSQKRLQIFYMPYNKKVIELFKNFPADSFYVEELYEALLSERRIGTKVILIRGKICSVELQIYNFASIRKVCLESNKNEFFISYYDYSIEREITSKNFIGEKINGLCDYIFPFIFTCGKDKRYIPLLLNDFSSFARYALEYASPTITEL